MIADIPERLQRYRAFYAAAEPALLVHIRCLERMDPSRPPKPYYLKRLREFDFHDRRDRVRWFGEILGEVAEENRLHAVPDDYLPSVKVLLGQGRASPE